MPNEMVVEVLRDADDRMSKAAEALRNNLSTIRTGRASPALVENLKVEVYGSQMPLNQIASISAPEPRLLVIRPWDANTTSAVEKAILKSDLGLTPSTDGQIIRLTIPRLTEERRQELVKLVSKRVEESRVAVRNCRRDSQDDLRDLEKEKMISEDDLYEGRDKLQEVTDKYNKLVAEIGEAKEHEIMEI